MVVTAAVEPGTKRRTCPSVNPDSAAFEDTCDVMSMMSISPLVLIDKYEFDILKSMPLFRSQPAYNIFPIAFI
jgi:hypothetical protein